MGSRSASIGYETDYFGTLRESQYGLVVKPSPIYSPYLMLFTAEGKRQSFLVERSYWAIGRGHENDLIIQDQTISRNHAILQSTEAGEFYLIDLGSRNGTFVNERRVGVPIKLKHADVIKFGKTETVFYCPDSPIKGVENDISPIDTMTSVLHERRLTSVMVVDMRNFTALARQLDDNVLSGLIGSWFRQSGNIIRQSGSWVDKYIGDAIMAVWFHHGDVATREEMLKIFRSVNALREMTAKLSCEYTLPFDLQVGVGINTGYAMVGNTGSGDHPDYTAIGDTVNAAFRLESITKEIGIDIAIGETSYKYLADLGDAVGVFKQYQVMLKGYEVPIMTYGTTFADLARFLKFGT